MGQVPEMLFPLPGVSPPSRSQVGTIAVFYRVRSEPQATLHKLHLENRLTENLSGVFYFSPF